MVAQQRVEEPALSPAVSAYRGQSPRGVVQPRVACVWFHQTSPRFPIRAALVPDWERLPPAALRAHFACTWSGRIPPHLPTTAAIVPDGYIDLQWVDGVLRVAGPFSIASCETLAAGAIVIGLRFRPGVAPAWLRIPASDIANARVPLDAFWGRDANEISDIASGGSTPEEIAHRLEMAVARKAATIGSVDRPFEGIFRRLCAGRGLQSNIVKTMREELGLSERTLRRHCHEAFGYGPKALERILRFQLFVRLARRSPSAQVARLATIAGYADQAHLTREAHELAGLTPLTIMRQFASGLAVSFKTP
jgi:AraC-like DNA-binding protein